MSTEIEVHIIGALKRIDELSKGFRIAFTFELRDEEKYKTIMLDLGK